LLKKPLTLAHIKPRLLGHCGTTPGPNFIYVHPNQVIKKYNPGIFPFSAPNTAVARCGEIVVALAVQ
jgi:xylulose-5-phosphate/fructose-6-phosphate phosphoketolase